MSGVRTEKTHDAQIARGGMEARVQPQDGFVEFWNHFPRRVGKLAAQKAYEKVRRDGTTQAELLEGIRRYVEGKPAYADWCHPRTWLSQGRWLDEYDAPVVAKATASDWGADCKRLHDGTCAGRWNHEWRMREAG